MSEERPYYGDNLTPEQRSKTMRAVRGRDTTPELALRKTLRCYGVSGYRVDVKKVPGRPDIVFGPKRLAVFVDGAFWHGRADRVRPGRSTYWDEKIARNQSRDRLNELQLRERGWNILRLWDDEVLADPEAAALRVLQKLNHYPAAEFFAGIGLVRRAIEDAGFKVVFANDINEKKLVVYANNFNTDHVWHGDIRRVFATQVPTVMLATASFPCTDLSLAGPRNGLDGLHSGVFWEFMRIMRDMGERRPPVVLLENVAGLRSSNDGEDLAIAIASLNELGYFCDILQLDARRWVPQSRQRVFVVASTRRLASPDDWGPDEIRPAWIKSFVDSHSSLQLQAARLTLPPQRELTLVDIVEKLDATNERWWDKERTDRFIDSLSSMNLSRLESLVAASKPIWRTAYRRTRGGQATWEIRSDAISGCLRTARGGSSRQALIEAGSGDLRIRWMTPREYARLMGAPDLDLIGVTENQALFGLGDAVCVPAINWLANEYLLPLAAGKLASQNGH